MHQWFACLIFTVVAFLAVDVRAQQGADQDISAFRLSREAAQVAGDIGVAPLMAQLYDERVRNGKPTADTLAIRQEIMERVTAASLDVDSVNAVVDFEIEHVRAVRGRLQARRDRAQNLVNVASIFGGGVAGVVGTAMQFTARTANLGNAISVGGGAGSVVLSLVGLREQGGTSDLGKSPRIISRFTGYEPPTAEEVSSVFPLTVWTYLNSVPTDKPSDSATRRQELQTKWQKEGKLDKDGLLKSEEKLKAAGLLGKQPPKLSIGEMDDVQAMLLDITASVSLMKRDLSEILRSLAIVETTK
ncbi:MAG TPA: hypothetical protein VGJ02_02850 [Pyrinomonadaceae bacterium]